MRRFSDVINLNNTKRNINSWQKSVPFIHCNCNFSTPNKNLQTLNPVSTRSHWAGMFSLCQEMCFYIYPVLLLAILVVSADTGDLPRVLMTRLCHHHHEWSLLTNQRPVCGSYEHPWLMEGRLITWGPSSPPLVSGSQQIGETQKQGIGQEESSLIRQDNK